MAISADILEKLGEVAVSVARIEQKMIRLDEISVDLTKAIKGNGKPGLLDRVSFIEEQHRIDTKAKEVVKEVKAKRQDFSTKVVLIMVTMVVSNVGVLIFGMIKLGIIK